MKVYVGSHLSLWEGGEVETVRVFDSEEKAINWRDSFKAHRMEFREIEEKEVE